MLCIQIEEERDMDEDERKAAEEDEKESEDAVKAARDSMEESCKKDLDFDAFMHIENDRIYHDFMKKGRE